MYAKYRSLNRRLEVAALIPAVHAWSTHHDACTHVYHVSRARLVSIRAPSFLSLSLPFRIRIRSIRSITSRVYKCGQEIIVIASRGAPLLSLSGCARCFLSGLSRLVCVGIERRASRRRYVIRRAPSLSWNLPWHRDRWHYVPVCNATRRILSKVTIEISCAYTFRFL